MWYWVIVIFGYVLDKDIMGNISCVGDLIHKFSDLHIKVTLMEYFLEVLLRDELWGYYCD